MIFWVAALFILLAN